MIIFTTAVRKGILEREFRIRAPFDESIAVSSATLGSELNAMSDLVKLKNELERLRIENSELREELASISGLDTGIDFN